MIRFLPQVLLLLASVSACAPPAPPTHRYLHLSHTRTDTNPYIDSVAALVDYAAYDMLWLGGDLALRSTANETAIRHLDSLFDLDSPTSLLSPGNHDYDRPDLLRTATGRPLFYTQWQDGLVISVLDTQDSVSQLVGDQLAMLRAVADTISAASHWVLLHHQLVWMRDGGELEATSDYVANGWFGDCAHCLRPNNFYGDVYPLLLKARQRGVQVLCVAGDLGKWCNEFQHTTADGIRFLASGIEAGDSANQVLLFEHRPASGELTWAFVPLDAL